MFTNKKLKTHKNRPVLGLNNRDADAASVTTNHRGVDVGSVYRNNTRHLLSNHIGHHRYFHHHLCYDDQDFTC